MVNKVILTGNVGNEPEYPTPEIAKFSFATSEYWKDKATGEQKSKTEWHNIVCYGAGLVSMVSNRVFKGSKLFIEGKMQTRKWVDKDGNDRYSTEVVLQGFSGIIEVMSSNSAPVAESAPQQVNSFDDDIPF